MTPVARALLDVLHRRAITRSLNRATNEMEARSFEGSYSALASRESEPELATLLCALEAATEALDQHILNRIVVEE